MAKIPLILNLKKKVHKELAESQDILVEEFCDNFEDGVLHGGTAIWRCYGSNRFSEDIDVYISRNRKKINRFFEKLEQEGFKPIKKRIKKNSLFSKFRHRGQIIRFEAVFKKVKSVLEDYEKASGEVITLHTLKPEQLIKEKASAYLKRRKIRDLYDVFFLVRYINPIPVKRSLRKLMRHYKPPKDEGDLKVLIIKGIAPKASEMMSYIKKRLRKWESKNT